MALTDVYGYMQDTEIASLSDDVVTQAMREQIVASLDMIKIELSNHQETNDWRDIINSKSREVEKYLYSEEVDVYELRKLLSNVTKDISYYLGLTLTS